MARQLPTKLTALELTDNFVQPTALVTIATAGAVTYNEAQFTSGLIFRDTNGAARTDTTPTVAQLYTELGNPGVNGSFPVTIRNTAAAANTLTVAGGTGVTTSGTMTVAQSNQKTFLFVFASPTTGTLYSMGTVVF